jgi:Ala-tRNA(Pro) deacylase
VNRCTAILDELNVEYEYHTHPAVFTTADVSLLSEKISGVDTKNLFLRDEKRTRYILVCVRAHTRVRLKDLGRQLGIKGITFASADEMQEMLGVTPGSVCLFSLCNDTQRRVAGYLDASIAQEDKMQNHPLINTATVVLRVTDMLRFCVRVEHPLERIEIPELQEGAQ